MRRVPEEEIRSALESILSDCGPCTFAEIMDRLREMFSGARIDWRIVRRVLAEMIKSGRVVSRPDYERGRFVFEGVGKG